MLYQLSYTRVLDLDYPSGGLRSRRVCQPGATPLQAGAAEEP